MQIQKVEAVCLSVIRTSIYLLVASPLIICGPFFSGFVVSKAIWIMLLSQIIFFAWLILAINSPRHRPKKSPLLFVFASFLLALVLSSILGVDSTRSFYSTFQRMTGLLMWLHLFALFLAASFTLKKNSWLKIFFLSVAVAIINSLTSWFALFQIEGILAPEKGSSLGNSSFFATYLLFNLFFAIYFFFYFRKKGVPNFLPFSFDKKIGLFLSGLGIIIMSISLIASWGRAATLSFFGGIILLFLFWWTIKTKGRIKTLGKIALLSSLITIVIAGILLHIPNSIIQQQFNNRTNGARAIVWQGAWQAFLERPILGWGPENFALSTNKYFNPQLTYIGEHQFDKAHNVVFETLVAGGIISLFLYLSIFAISFWMLWRQSHNKKLCCLSPIILTTILITYFIQNLTVFDTPISLLMLSLVLAFINSINQEGKKNKVTAKKYKRITLIALPLLLIGLVSCLFFFILKPLAASTYTYKLLSVQELENKSLVYKKAFYYSPADQGEIRKYLGLQVIKNEQEGEAIPAWEINLMEEELENNIKNSPLDYYNYIVLARLYKLDASLFDKTKLAEAEKVLNQAIELSPTNPVAYWDLNQITTPQD